MQNFPIHGEKGITTFDLVQNSTSEDQDEPDYELISFESGQRYNMVPDHAQARVFVKENMTDVVQHFEHYLDQHKLQGESVVDSGELVLTLEGKVHGMDPSLGVNRFIFIRFHINIKFKSNGKRVCRL